MAKSAFKPFYILGAATNVYFHVTVMSLDTIDEGSMVSSLSNRDRSIT